MDVVLFIVIVVCAGAVMAALSLYTDRKAQQAQRYADAKSDLDENKGWFDEAKESLEAEVAAHERSTLYTFKDQDVIAKAYQDWYMKAAKTMDTVDAEIKKPKSKRKATTKVKATKKANKTAKLRGDRG